MHVDATLDAGRALNTCSSEDRKLSSGPTGNLIQLERNLPPRLPVTCSAEAGRPASRVHPVSLHPLHQSHRRHGHLVVLLPKLQELSKPRDVEARV